MLIKKGTVNNKNHNLSIIDKEEKKILQKYAKFFPIT